MFHYNLQNGIKAFTIINFGELKTITEIIKDYIRNNGVKSSHLADKLNMSRQNFNNRMRVNDLPTSFLLDISKALKYDFFRLFSDELANSGVVFREDAKNYDYKEKYLDVLEDVRSMSKENRELTKELEALKKNKDSNISAADKGTSKLEIN